MSVFHSSAPCRSFTAGAVHSGASAGTAGRPAVLLPALQKRGFKTVARLSLARTITELRAAARAKADSSAVLPTAGAQNDKVLRRDRTISISAEMKALITQERQLEQLIKEEQRQDGSQQQQQQRLQQQQTGGSGSPISGEMQCDDQDEAEMDKDSEALVSSSSWLPAFPLSKRVRSLLLLNVLVVLLATNWSIVKQGGDALDPFTFAFLRFGVAAAALTPFFMKAIKNKDMVKAGIELGAWSAAGYLTQSLGLMYTDASRASFLSTFTVIVVPLISGFTGKGVKPFVWLSVAAAVVGVGLLEQSGTAFNAGDIWSFLSAVFFGIQVYRTEIVSRRMPEGQTLPLISIVMAVIAASAGASALIAHPTALVDLAHNSLAADKQMLWALPWAAILYTGLLSTDAALVCEFEALQHVSSIECALVYTLEPVLGAAFAWVLLGERWGPAGWVGAGLIVGSSFATQIFGSDSTTTAEPAAVVVESRKDQ